MKPIFVIGFMGTGKSTVGRLLAERLGREFVDLDNRIEQEAQATVDEIFVAEGENGFRLRERAALRRACALGPVVVAVGGGAPAHADNLDRILGAGTVVCLEAGPDEILTRIGDARSRPLLARAPEKDRRAEVVRLLGQRAAFYARAHVTVGTTDKPPSQVLTEVLERLGC